ncbi:putative cyclin-dependent serine/threonine-protein kinase DDB_G0272797/DDB_G0274007 [Nymphalis io]|uniref:putative cyclin-dependent serine/threonine-protein kinase DDB_G0272797/DDB_G0274007 n=1 Tax=Inachis io TaxID=171585 RepID=UPI00216A6579|nr:putative cyclin-dependent serine/threonine-protein kinase DDB_G0272797/DDB_G0274007 [Nymphalis io]
MRWFSVVIFCLALTAIIADPDPKKFKNESNEKDKKAEALTNDEKIFLREVEEKFGVKSDVPVQSEKKESKTKVDEKNKGTSSSQQKPPFPAVIAIEIVNDTDSKSKGKRTIDANLGYGYRTNNGYTYTYFGKSNQDKGKFMIYPYSQEDIPTNQNSHDTKYSSYSKSKYSSSSTDVEIQPSQAYELVPVNNEETSYEYKKPAVEFKDNYENISETPSVGYSEGKAAQTLYTTYNGQEFSGLSGQFPTVMPNYFVNPTQLLNNPYYQNAGLTQDHLRTQNSYLTQNKGIVPVLVLRVPSSYLKNPTAELYPDLPNNYPLSQHLNSVNLQELVNQYFKKNGFSSAPQIMSYQSQSVSSPETRPQHYSNPYVKPTYTQADYSGIQYSAVKPVMARYPLTYTQQKYLVSQPQSLYQSPASQQHHQQQQPQQQYEYEYRYVPQTEVKMRSYYIQPQYQQSAQSGAISNEYQQYDQSVTQQKPNSDDALSNIEYRTPQYSSSHQTEEASVEYDTQNAAQVSAQPDVSHYVSANSEANGYDLTKQNDYTKQSESSGYNTASLPSYSSSSDYYSTQTGQKSSVSILPSKLIHTEQYQDNTGSNEPQQYAYQSEKIEDSKTYVLSENYPSKDHTIATVLPYSYNSNTKPSQSSIQTVSYVTPMPSAKYQSQYNVMVPQTVLKNPNNEKVSYVNSQSLHYLQAGQYTDSNSGSDYAVGSQYVQQIANQPSYPRNYHAHPKRMVKAPMKTLSKLSPRKTNERSEKKKST